MSILATLENPFAVTVVALLAPLAILGALIALEGGRDRLIVVFVIANKGVRIRGTWWAVEGAGGFWSAITSGRRGGIRGGGSRRRGSGVCVHCKLGLNFIGKRLAKVMKMGRELMLKAIRFSKVSVVGQRRRARRGGSILRNEDWGEKIDKVGPGLIGFRIPRI